MSKTDQQILFKNMHPSDEVRSYADAVMQRILETAPYDSHALALLEKVEEGYRATIDIYSKDGPFIAESLAQNPTQALDELAGELSARIAQTSLI
jgi:hypothetical protein